MIRERWYWTGRIITCVLVLLFICAMGVLLFLGLMGGWLVAEYLMEFFEGTVANRVEVSRL